MNIDRTHKENVLYIKEGTNVKTISSFNLSDISLEDMYNFVKEDLALAQYNQINEEEEEMEFDEEGFPTSFPNNSEPVKELGFLGQDIITSENPVVDLIINAEDAFKRNVSLECNDNNYVNVLAGALKQAIQKIYFLKMNNLRFFIIYYKEKRTVNFEFWDSPRKEQLKNIAKLFYKNVSVCVLVYDMTNKNSFDEDSEQISDLEKNTEMNTEIQQTDSEDGALNPEDKNNEDSQTENEEKEIPASLPDYESPVIIESSDVKENNDAENTPASDSSESNPSGLFNPVTGLGWESYLDTRLENEINRAISSEIDISVFIINIPNLERESEESKKISEYLSLQFQFKDLLFEYV